MRAGGDCRPLVHVSPAPGAADERSQGAAGGAVFGAPDQQPAEGQLAVQDALPKLHTAGSDRGAPLEDREEHIHGLRGGHHPATADEARTGRL